LRLTNNIISKNYLKSLNKSLNELSQMNTLIAAKRKYMNFADDPINAMRAMKVRQNINKIDVYVENLREAADIFSQYESVISNVNNIVSDALVQVSQGMNGTSDATARYTIAQSLRAFQDAILAAVNTQFAGKYIFSGETVGVPPFSISEEEDTKGMLLYKGMLVDNISEVTEKRYIDIGLGLSLDEYSNVIHNTARDIAVTGLELLGCGVDEDGYTKNLYNMLGIIAKKFEENDMSGMDVYYEKLQKIADNVRVQYVGVGEKTEYINFFLERLDSEQFNLKVKQSRLEGLDLAEAITTFGELELAYNACLQIGTKILQPSLLDFLD